MQKALARWVLLIFSFTTLAALAGCSTVDRKDFDDLAFQVSRMARQQQLMKKRLDQLENQAKAASVPRATMVTDLDSVKRKLAVLENSMNETMQKLQQDKAASAGKGDVKTKELETRLTKVEGYLGMGKDGRAPAGPAPSRVAAPAAPARPAGPKDFYNLAMRLYKKRSYAAARGRFEALIKRYPRSSLAGSAHFWIGETYYSQRKYEEAILSYNQVIKRYRRSGKVPAALLKQGLAFVALGDRRTARIVLGKLIRSYPRSSQARVAKRRLARLR